MQASDAEAVPAASATAMTKHKKVRRGKKSKKRKAEEEPQNAQSAAVDAGVDGSGQLPKPKKSKKDKTRTKKEKKEKREKGERNDEENVGTGEGGSENMADDAGPPIDAVTISAADAASGMDIDRALKLAEKQRQKDKRAAKKAKAEQEAAKASKQARRNRVAAANPSHDRRDSETPVWMACKEYLDTWKRRKSAWKFQKVRQVWLLQHMYDTEQVSNDTFAIMVEYLQGLKGAGRTTTLAKAETVLSEAASSEGPNSTDDDKESVVQQRAAAVIKVLQQFEQ